MRLSSSLSRMYCSKSFMLLPAPPVAMPQRTLRLGKDTSFHRLWLSRTPKLERVALMEQEVEDIHEHYALVVLIGLDGVFGDDQLHKTVVDQL